MTLTPKHSFVTLLLVQTVHLLHHRLARRHISFAEVISSATLCVPLSLAIPGWTYSSVHIAMIVVQVVGSVWIGRLSPAWGL